MFRLQVVFLVVALFLMVGCGGSPNGTSSNSSQSSAPTAVVPSSAKVVTDIQKMPSWGSCSSNCSGEPGTNASYSMDQGIATPSLSGSAIKFNILDGTPWNTALWWKQVGGDDSKTHFAYEISYYVANPDAAQALEFNVNQNAGGWRYEYATQCDFRGAGLWRIWDHSQMHWVATSVPCPTPVANQWNKLIWEFERTADHQVTWVAVTLNGQRSVVNRSFGAFTASGSGIDVAFQMDSTGVVTPWSVWVDAVHLSEW